jgi:tetratricopeptide (TPR) repeat protein
MNTDLRPLRVFVAMPGTTMGLNALWNNPEEIKDLFYDGIRTLAARELKRDVELIIEKDKTGGGDILLSMYRECWMADVYIADLTGSNPNVYLELGARWALCSWVTIIVSQSIDELEFNVASSRSIQYAKRPDLLSDAINSVVRAIDKGLRDRQVDSPVRQALPDVVIETRAEHDYLIEAEQKGKVLIQQLGLAYVAAGRFAQNASDRITNFQKAVEADPLCEAGYVEWSSELRNMGEDETASVIASRGISQLGDSAALYGQLGLAYSKQPNRIDDAINSLMKALELAPSDAELLSNLGGALRRKAFSEPGRVNMYYAQRARDNYQQALDLANNDWSTHRNEARAYALGNVARLDFVLSQNDPDKANLAIEELRRLREICDEALRINPADYYRIFDLADSYLLAGELDEGLNQYRKGINAVPLEYRVGALSSVATPLKQYVTIGLRDLRMRRAMEEVLSNLEDAAKQADS